MTRRYAPLLLSALLLACSSGTVSVVDGETAAETAEDDTVASDPGGEESLPDVAADLRADDGAAGDPDAAPDFSEPGDGVEASDPRPDAGDAAGDPDADSVCPAVPAPDPVPEGPLPGEAAPGRSEATTVNGFHDEYLYDATDYIKIGARREWGGSIIFFGLKGTYGAGMNPNNTIDANDTGREVQVAFYDPDRAMQNCAWNASCRTTPSACPNSITFLGWDPVQGGNRCNRGSGVESVVNAGGLLQITTNPLFWNPNWDRTDCSDAACSNPALRDRRSDVRVVQAARFVRTHVVELTYTVVNLADLDHASTNQEMPTLYSANGHGGPDLWRLFNSDSVEIAIDTPAGGDGFYYENFTSGGGWVTLQNSAANYGVGIYYENRTSRFQGWQLRSLPFNNVRALFPFAIPARGTVKARAYLVLGALATVASEAGWLDAHIPPFGSLDVPAADATISGTAAIGGWALDNKGVAAVTLVVDGTVEVALATGGARPDVCLVWPGYPGCGGPGFSGTVDTSALSPCAHLFEIKATDTDGNERIIARRRVTVTR